MYLRAVAIIKIMSELVLVIFLIAMSKYTYFTKKICQGKGFIWLAVPGIHQVREGMVTQPLERAANWLPCICSEEAEGTEGWCLAHFLLFIWSGTLA